jgi:hypothetical protein
MKLKRPPLAFVLAVLKKVVSKAGTAQSQCHIKHYFTDFLKMRGCVSYLVDWRPPIATIY